MTDQRTERERDPDYRCPSCGFAPRVTIEASHAADCPQLAGAVTREQLDAAQATLEMLRDEVTDALTQYGEGSTEHLASRDRVARQNRTLADLQARAAKEAADADEKPREVMFVNESRTLYVSQWSNEPGVVYVATREDASDVWGPPQTLTRDH